MGICLFSPQKEQEEEKGAKDGLKNKTIKIQEVFQIVYSRRFFVRLCIN